MENRNLIKESQGIVDKPGIEWKTFSKDIVNYLCKNNCSFLKEIINFLQNHKVCRFGISSNSEQNDDTLIQHMPKWLSTLYIYISDDPKSVYCNSAGQFHPNVSKLENDKLVGTISLGCLQKYLNDKDAKKIVKDKNNIISILIHELQHAYSYYIQLYKSQKSSLNNYSGNSLVNMIATDVDFTNTTNWLSQLFYLLDFDEMKSRLHEFSFKLNDVNYKNLFKNYKCPSIDSKINIIDEIKKDNEIINEKDLNEFEMYLIRYFQTFKRKYYFNYYIDVDPDHSSKFDFNIDYIKTYNQLLKIDINTIINKNKKACNDIIISFILNGDALGNVFANITQYNSAKKIYDAIFIENRGKFLTNEHNAKIAFKKVYKDIAALFNKPAEKYLKLIDNGYKATDIFKKLQPILLNRLNIFKKAINKIIYNAYIKNPDKWNSWIYDVIKEKYNIIKKYYQEGAKLQEKFENDQIMQKAFILWNKYNSQKTEENKEKLDNYLNEKSK